MTDDALKVKQAEQGKPLVGFLATRLGLSGKKAKALLDQRAVFVNNKPVWMAHHRLKAGDHISVTRLPSLTPADSIPILHRDDDYIVASKPPALLSNGPGSLEDLLRKQCSEPSIKAVHRLDRDTSGCLLFATNESAREKMVELFKQHAVKKSYHAIVVGFFPEASCSITKPVEGLSATTLIRRLDACKQASHLQISIVTGRTHQIRRHLSTIHHRILGDRQYGTHRPTSERVDVLRQMLHATELRFRHPKTHKALSVRSPLPKDFKQCLKSFRLS